MDVIQDKDDIKLDKMSLNTLKLLKEKADKGQISRNDISSLEDSFREKFISTPIASFTSTHSSHNSRLLSDNINAVILNPKLNVYEHMRLVNNIINNLENYLCFYNEVQMVNLKAFFLSTIFIDENSDDKKPKIDINVTDFIWSNKDLFTQINQDERYQAVTEQIEESTSNYTAIDYISRNTVPIELDRSSFRYTTRKVIDTKVSPNAKQLSSVTIETIYRTINDFPMDKIVYFNDLILGLKEYLKRIELEFNSQWNFITELIEENTTVLITYKNIYNSETLLLMRLLNDLKNNSDIA